jgi:hypothetical protein
MAIFPSSWVSIIFVLMLFLGLSGSAIMPVSGIKKKISILTGSKLYLSGTSNVNKFNCDCIDQYPDQILEAINSGGYVQFAKGGLQIKTRKFDCHNRKIDADMQKALDAEHFPCIQVSLIDALQDVKCLHGGCKDWFDIQANVHITLKETTKKEFLYAKAKVLGPNLFQVRGEKALQMSAYGINPPEALFGMIKVNDEIIFKFDLILSVEPIQ